MVPVILRGCRYLVCRNRQEKGKKDIFFFLMALLFGSYLGRERERLLEYGRWVMSYIFIKYEHMLIAAISGEEGWM